VKIWGGELSREAEEFTAGKDIALDAKLVYWDAIASLAHALMLKKIGILSKKEFGCIKKGLLEVVALDKKGKFNLKPELEDVHSNIEFFLCKKCGKGGKKIHTARSRNDQAATDMLLYMKEELLRLLGWLSGSAKSPWGRQGGRNFQCRATPTRERLCLQA
jgi:argininosuccinate lyase